MDDISRANGYNTYRSNDRTDDMPERPPSDALVDLHVYLVPHNLWRERYNNFLNQNVTETVSAGIIRVHPEQRVIVLRDEIDSQIGAELVPRDYVFLKSVGRSITKLKSKQEYQLKVKNFIPPQSYAPELFLLEAQDVDSSRSSVRPESPEYHTGRKSDRTPYTSHNTNPTSPEYNMSSAENLQTRHAAGGKPSYPSHFRQSSPIPKIPIKNNPNSSRYEPMEPDTPDDVINSYSTSHIPPRQSDQSPPSREDRSDPTSHPRRGRATDRGHDPTSGHDSDTPTDMHHRDRLSPQRDIEHSRSPARVSNRRPQSPDRAVENNRSVRRQTSQSPPRQGNVSPPRQDYPSQRNRDRSPGRQGDLSPPRQGNLSPPRQEYPTQRNRDRSPAARQGNRSPPRQGNRSPPRQGDRSPPRQGNLSPPRQEYPTQRSRDRSPGRQVDQSPPRQGNRSPPRQGNRSPPNQEYPSQRGRGRSPPRYVNQDDPLRDKPSENLARIDDDNVATPPKHAERPRDVPAKRGQGKSPVSKGEQPQVKGGRVTSPAPHKVQTNGTDRPLSASWGSDSHKSQSPTGGAPTKQNPQAKAVPGRAVNVTPPPLVESSRPVAATNKYEPKYESSSRPAAAGNKYDPRLEAYTNHTNEDSGIAVITPEDHYGENQDDALDRRKRDEEEKRRREAELQNRLKADQEERESKDKREKEWPRHEKMDEERRQKDQGDKRQREGQRRRHEEDVNRREEEEESRREEERNLDRLSASDEELTRFPSPPPLKITSPPSSKDPRDSLGDTDRGQQGKTEKERLLRDLEQAREARKTTEKSREDLVKKAKLLQNKMQNRRNHARDLWKKRYFEEKKRTSPLEEQCNRLRHELEIIHRKLMNTLEGPAKDKSTQRVGDLKPSLQSNYKIQAARLMHEIEDIRRRLENAKMKLTAEMKLRNQAETELRAMRAELIQKKINRTLTRHQQQFPSSLSVSDPFLNQTAVSPRS